jgi:hypothetical protein
MAPTGAETPVEVLAMAEGLLWNPNGLLLVWCSEEKLQCALL